MRLPGANRSRLRPLTSNRAADYRPENAVDGLPDTRWSSEFSDLQWLAIDLGAPTRISRVVLDWEIACGQSYAIQVSLDGSTWTDV